MKGIVFTRWRSDGDRNKLGPTSVDANGYMIHAMLRAGLFFTLLMLTASSGRAQDHTLFDSYQAFKDSLTALTQLADATERNNQLSTFWDSLKAHNQIPFKHGTSAAFLYRGSSASVQFPGDFNSWTPPHGSATRMSPSDVWIREESFPDDARLDYKILLNGNQWILDPSNPLTQRGGFGNNSELRMPAYVPSPWIKRIDGVPMGSFSGNISLSSTSLGYAVNYRVYTPPGYESDQLSDLPVIYVTDGHEYSHDEIGSMRIVLDNLIAAQEIVPVLAVFIDPRVGGANLRVSQYIENAKFASFVADELVPVIDRTYRTDPRRYARAIMGTSLGGLNAAYFAADETDTFYLIGIQSPAFHAGDSIYDLYLNEPVRNVRIHMSWGTIHDVGNAGEVMATILSDKGYTYETLVLNEGHSWGSWRALLDDVLTYFWGPDSNVSVQDQDLPTALGLEPSYPNPFFLSTTIPFTLSHTSTVRLSVYNVLGQQVALLIDGIHAPGRHVVTWNPNNQPGGTYFYRLEASDQPAYTGTLVFLK